MFPLADYLHHGREFLNHSLLGRRRLAVLMLYTTDACNSACRHCRIWTRQPKTFLPFRTIREVIESPVVTRRTKIGLEGGEFLLHPECEAIAAWLAARGANFEILSNGLLPDRLLSLVRACRVPRVYLSLDGDRAGVQSVRGMDGYDRIVGLLAALAGHTRVTLLYTVTPWNRGHDLAHVAAVARAHAVDLRVGLYAAMDYFRVDVPESAVGAALGDLDPAAVADFPHNQRYLELAAAYLRGEVRLPCWSIRQMAVIHPDGSVPLCQRLPLVLGNVHQRPLAEIWTDPATIRRQREHRDCNGCWINFHRKFDLVLHQSVGRFLPGGIRRALFGACRLPP